MAEKERPWWQHRNAPPAGYKPPPRPQEPPPRKPPVMPENRGDQQWWQDKRVPRQVQEQTEPRDRPPQRKPPMGQGQGSPDPYGAAPPQEQDRMLRGAFQAGINGDDGALQSFPNTPFGQRLRQEFMRGRQQRQKPQRGLGFSGLDRG